MRKLTVYDFGIVDPMGDYYELHWESGKKSFTRLDFIVQTERGPIRNEIASIPSNLWESLYIRIARELIEGMGESERSKKAPAMKKGTNRFSPLIGRELAVLLWTLMEAGSQGNIEAILHGWRELAREERWWLYAKAAAPGQRDGAGWRLALFHALSETTESRAADSVVTEKKSPGNGLRHCKRNPMKRKKLPASRMNQVAQITMTMVGKIKKHPKPPTADLKEKEAKNPEEIKVKKMVRKAAQNN